MLRLLSHKQNNTSDVISAPPVYCFLNIWKKANVGIFLTSLSNYNYDHIFPKICDFIRKRKLWDLALLGQSPSLPPLFPTSPALTSHQFPASVLSMGISPDLCPLSVLGQLLFSLFQISWGLEGWGKVLSLQQF